MRISPWLEFTAAPSSWLASWPKTKHFFLAKNLSRRIFLVLFSAGLLISCFPPFDFQYLAWIALVPLFIGIRNQSPLTTAGLCFLHGYCFLIGVFFWITGVDAFKWMDFVLAGVYL